MAEFNHNDFEIVRVVAQFGGYEELRHKNKDIAEHTRFVRKSVTPNNVDEFNALMKLEEKVMSSGCSGTAYPVYEHDGRKWVLMSVPSKFFGATGLHTNDPDV